MARYSFRTADLIMVGWTVGTSGISALAFGFTVYMLMVVGFGFQFFNLVCSRAYAGIGDTRTPMYVRGCCREHSLNGVLTFGFGPIPALAIVGAGLGTLLATAFAAVTFAFLLAGYEPELTFRVPDRHWDSAVVREFLRIASPAVGRKVLKTGARFPLLVILATFGTGAVAAYEVGRRVLQFVRTPMWGLNFSASTLVGQSLGSGDVDAATAYVRDITILPLVILIPIFVLVAVFPAQLGKVFVQDTETIALVVFFLQIYAVGGIGYTLDETLSGALTGAGDTRWPFYGTLVGLYVILVPGAYLLGITLGFGLLGVGIALLAEFYVPAAFNYYRIRSGRWTEWSLSNDQTTE